MAIVATDIKPGRSAVQVQGSLLFVTYTIIQGIISSEMLVRTGPLVTGVIRVLDDFSSSAFAAFEVDVLQRGESRP